MSLNDLFKKAAFGLQKRQATHFTVDREKQEAFLSRIPEPKDGFERSYAQYKCQMFLSGKLVELTSNIGAFFFVMIKLLRKRNAPKAEKKLDERPSIFRRGGKPTNIAPEPLLQEFAPVLLDPPRGDFLSKEDKQFIWKIIKRYPFSWMLTLKCLIKIEAYSYAIKRYNPRAIIVCSEFSYTSSILTQYCESKGVLHINVMHGEKLYYIRDAFFRFSRCYVWNDSFRTLFETLRADKAQFIIQKPSSLVFKDTGRIEKVYDFTYYLGYESDEELRRIRKHLMILQSKGYSINIRPHPRYSDAERIQKIYNDIPIEDTKTCNIEVSVLRSKHVVSLYSTVLRQAYENNVDVVIDDLTNPENYKKLSNLGYTMLLCISERLSKWVGK